MTINRGSTGNRRYAEPTRRTVLPVGTLIAVPCLDCKAQPGEQCVTASGKTSDKVHRVRRHHAMQRWFEQEHGPVDPPAVSGPTCVCERCGATVPATAQGRPRSHRVGQDGASRVRSGLSVPCIGS